MAATVTFTGSVVQNGVPVAGTFKVASTTTAAGASCAIGPSGGVKVALSVSLGDLLTFTSDTGTSVTKTTTLAVTPTAGQAFPIVWDTGANVLSGV